MDCSTLPANAAEHIGLVQSANYRSTFDIIWGCLLTISLCTWSMQRLNVPSPEESTVRAFLRKLLWSTITALAPEALTLVSSEQYFTANFEADLMQKEGGYVWWTRKHAFLSIMGGIMLRYQNGKELIVQADQLLWLKRYGHFVIEKSSGTEMDNQGHVDGFTRVWFIAQLIWFIVACIGRLAQELRFTLVEIEVLPYIVTSLMTLYFWWEKPGTARNRIVLYAPRIEEHVVVQMMQQTAYHGDHKLLAARLRNYNCVPSLSPARYKSVLPNVLFGILENSIFGGCQFLAWNYSFPSRTEQIMFRVASVLALVPPFFLLFSITFIWIQFRFIIDARGVFRSLLSGRLSLLSVVAPMYALARLCIIVEVFLALRSSPAGVYQVVQWSDFLPSWK